MRRMMVFVGVVALVVAMVAASAVTGLAQEEIDEEDWGKYQYQPEQDWGSGPGGPDDDCTDYYGADGTYYGCGGLIVPPVEV